MKEQLPAKASTEESILVKPLETILPRACPTPVLARKSCCLPTVT